MVGPTPRMKYFVNKLIMLLVTAHHMMQHLILEQQLKEMSRKKCRNVDKHCVKGDS